jgi:hypothetical protein
MADTYRFRVRGHLDDGWSEWFGGLAVRRRADGTTTLTGPVADQAALHGVIARIRDLGLPLLSLGQATEPRGGTDRALRLYEAQTMRRTR